jgi:putative transposase
MNRLGQFFLCIPRPLEVRCENQAPAYTPEQERDGAGVVALDPGIRTFQTCYDPSGLVAEWGKGDITRIYRLCCAYDKLQSKWSQKNVRHRRRYKMKRAGLRIQAKIRNLVDDLHKKMVSWLCHNYKVILLPSFKTSHMLRRGHRRIRSKTARNMATWAHYRFKQRLLHKAREFPWCMPIICDEHHTSKTCGRCGRLNSKLGGNKIFSCSECGFILDRDINGARNILIRYLTLHCNREILHARKTKK